MIRYLPPLIFLLFIASMMRDDFALTLIYLFAATFAVGIWWSNKALKQVGVVRKAGTHAFFGEKIEVKLKIDNPGWLPAVWLKIQDALPVGISTSPAFTRVTSLGPRNSIDFSYSLEASKRGYYALGPLFITSGDLLGLQSDQVVEKPAQYITVYPRIITLSKVDIPSRSPQGTLRHKQPIFEDPSRIFGKRDYHAGDSLRRVDWKASASSGRLQVKLFESSIALETLIILDLNTQDYDYRSRIDASELSIVIASSLASWVSARHQSVGLKVHGVDTPLGKEAQYLPPRKGHAHLVRILETLARAGLAEGAPLGEVIEQQRCQLPWGTTLVVITGQSNPDVLDQLHMAHRSGQNALLILSGPVAHDPLTAHRAALLGIPVVNIANERDLDQWRK